jgi:hypothetical protein
MLADGAQLAARKVGTQRPRHRLSAGAVAGLNGGVISWVPWRSWLGGSERAHRHLETWPGILERLATDLLGQGRARKSAVSPDVAALTAVLQAAAGTDPRRMSLTSTVALAVIRATRPARATQRELAAAAPVVDAERVTEAVNRILALFSLAPDPTTWGTASHAPVPGCLPPADWVGVGLEWLEEAGIGTRLDASEFLATLGVSDLSQILAYGWSQDASAALIRFYRLPDSPHWPGWVSWPVWGVGGMGHAWQLPEKQTIARWPLPAAIGAVRRETRTGNARWWTPDWTLDDPDVADQIDTTDMEARLLELDQAALRRFAAVFPHTALSARKALTPETPWGKTPPVAGHELPAGWLRAVFDDVRAQLR